MKLQFRLGEYITLTSFVWGLYLIWLIPFQFYVVGLTVDQFWTWLIVGTMFEMIIAYPLSKAIIWGGIRINLYWANKSDKA
jgi:hypothetical protein